MPNLQEDISGTARPRTDDDLVGRARERDSNALRAIIKTHNQRLYRIARSIVRNNSEAEDVLQESYVRAFSHLGEFRGEASFATWLSRIVINEALGRLRKQRRSSTVIACDDASRSRIIPFPLNMSSDDPERTMAQRQILDLVEQATDNLPNEFRTVFVARVIQGLSLQETADVLELRPETVKTRLHRARHLLRKDVEKRIGPLLLNAFPFAGRRCDRLTAAVMSRLGFRD